MSALGLPSRATALWLVPLVSGLALMVVNRSEERARASEITHLAARISHLEGVSAADRARMTSAVIAHLDSLRQTSVRRPPRRLSTVDLNRGGACITVTVVDSVGSLQDSTVSVRVTRDGLVQSRKLGSTCS